jgi:hypothetical protein
MPISRKMSIMCYGDTGVGKTTQFRYFAEYVHQRYGLKSRMICTDGGSLWECVQDFIDEGWVDAIQVPTAPEYNPFSVMRKFGRGQWPEGGRINAPTPTLVSGTIKYQTNTKWTAWGAKETAEIGLVCTDSLTGYSSAFMFDASVKNIRTGENANPTTRTEEGETSGSNTISHYGDVQNEIKNYINSIVALPAPFSYFTALAGGGTEKTDGVKRPVLGPQIAGTAATGELPKLVTNCFHLVGVGNGAQRIVQAWYEEHPDDQMTKIEWKAKASSFLPQQKMEWVKRHPKGFFPLSLDKGIRDFLDFKDLMDEKLKESKNAAVKVAV